MPVSIHKAKKILRHGEVGGRSLTKPQKGFFGARVGGQPVRGLKKNPNAAKRRLNRLQGDRVSIYPITPITKKKPKKKKKTIVELPIYKS